jgi:hypothetical protein
VPRESDGSGRAADARRAEAGLERTARREEGTQRTKSHHGATVRVCRRSGSPKKSTQEKKWFITDFWNLIKEQQPQGGLTIDSRWL